MGIFGRITTQRNYFVSRRVLFCSDNKNNIRSDSEKGEGEDDGTLEITNTIYDTLLAGAKKYDTFSKRVKNERVGAAALESINFFIAARVLNLKEHYRHLIEGRTPPPLEESSDSEEESDTDSDDDSDTEVDFEDFDGDSDDGDSDTDSSDDEKQLEAQKNIHRLVEESLQEATAEMPSEALEDMMIFSPSDDEADPTSTDKSTDEEGKLQLPHDTKLLNRLKKGTYVNVLEESFAELKKLSPERQEYLLDVGFSGIRQMNKVLSVIENFDACVPKNLKFFIGDMIVHKKYAYGGLIVGYHDKCRQGRLWQTRVGVTNPDQPFYEVLVDDRESPALIEGERWTYVAESNICLANDMFSAEKALKEKKEPEERPQEINLNELKVRMMRLVKGRGLLEKGLHISNTELSKAFVWEEKGRYIPSLSLLERCLSENKEHLKTDETLRENNPHGMP